MDIVKAIGWLVAAQATVLLLWPFLKTQIWLWHGRELSRMFDNMMAMRATMLDPYVRSDASNEEKRQRIEQFLGWMHEHSRHRDEWMRRAP